MKKRKKILFIVSRLPINTETGDRLRVYHFIRKLKEKGHQVDIMGFVPAVNYTVRTDIEQLCYQCIGIEKEGIEFENPSRIEQITAFGQSFFLKYPYRVWQWYDEDFLNQAKELIRYHDYDVIHFSEVAMGFVLQALEDLPAKPRVVYDLIDSVALSLKNSLVNDISLLWPFRLIEQMRLKKFEQWVAERVDRALLISERDKRFLQLDSIKVIPNGIEENKLTERTRDIDLLFTGNMAAEANIDAVCWFVNDVMPILLAKNKNLHFTIAGANPSDAVKKLELDNITVTGFVQDIDEYYRRAKIFVCPMRLGAGQKNKIMEAMINKTPVISTTEGNIGIDAPKKAIAIADNAEEFANAVLTLLEKEEKRIQLAENGYQYVKKTFSWEKSVDILEQCYEE